MTKRPALSQMLASGDVGAFLGLAVDNIAQLIAFCGILIGVFKYPADVVLGRMLPGTALGVLLGDLLYSYLALRLARRLGRADVTAMPLGIDTPSLYGLSFGVLGPVFAQTHDALLSFQVGMAVMVLMGLCKIALSFVAGRLAQLLPQAALLGTIGGVGLLFIAFMPMGKVVAAPHLALPLLFTMLLALLRGQRLGRVPVVLLLVVGGTLVHLLLQRLHLLPAPEAAPGGLQLALPLPSLAFWRGLPLAIGYLPIALPLAFVTVVGGIDVTASARSAGDDYAVRDVLLVEGVSTLVAGLAGGVIQTTPYIGHPAYKRMGARVGYTLATALVVGLSGVFGLLAVLVHLLPEVVVVPFLLFIGLEITAQCFRQVPERHAPAVAASFLPVIAAMVVLAAGPGGGDALAPLRVLGSGFVFGSLVYGAALAYLIDGRGGAAALVLLTAALGSLCGLLHSPLPGSALFWPWRAPSELPLRFAIGYAATAALVLLQARLAAPEGFTEPGGMTDHER